MYHKNQHILLLIHQLDPSKKALNHALKIGTIFKAKVLICKSPFTKNAIASETIENYISEHDQVEHIQLENTKAEPNKSINQLNIIFMLIDIDAKNDFKFYLKNNIFSWVLNAKIPTFLIGKKTSNQTDYSNIILPIDHKKESKEKMIWASYFGRFNKAVVQLIPASEKDEIPAKTIRNTLLFTKKMFSQFLFDYKIHKSNTSSKHIDEEAFKAATTNASDLIILMTGKAQGIFFLRYNSKKIKQVISQYSNPILLINPLKDYYLPCER